MNNINKILIIALMFINSAESMAEFNARKSLSPADKVRVSKAVAQAYAQGAIKDQIQVMRGGSGQSSNAASAGSTVNVGNVHNTKRARVEQTVVTGDITNVCLHCR